MQKCKRKRKVDPDPGLDIWKPFSATILFRLSLIGPESLQGSILKFNQCMLHFRCILVLLCQNAFALKDVQQNPYKKLTVCPKCTFSNATFYPGLAAEALHKVPIVSLREPKHCIFIAKFHFFNLWTL